MKIGLVRYGFSTTGGAERYLLRFAKALNQAGHESILFGSSDWIKKPSTSNIEDYPTWSGELKSIDAKNPLQFAKQLQAIKPKEHCDFLFSLERVLECDAYRAGDGVHRAWLERRASAELPSRWKAWFRNLQSKHRQILKLEQALYCPPSNIQRTIITNSKLVSHEIANYYGSSFPNRNIEIVYNGISLANVAQQLTPQNKLEQRKRLGISPNDFVILFVGSSWKRKGLSYALKAFQHFYEVHFAKVAPAIKQKLKPLFLVVGRGNPKLYQKNFKNKNSHWSQRVHFVGPVLNPDSYYQSADLFLLPTLYDPFSNACLEAYRAGLPVITTAANGFSEILDCGVDGEIVENSEQIESLSEAIFKWLDRDRRANCTTRIQEKLPRFSIDKHVNQTLKVLLE